MNLVFAETIIAVYGIPVDFTASLLQGWKMGKMLCYTTGFLLTFSGKFCWIINWIENDTKICCFSIESNELFLKFELQLFIYFRIKMWKEFFKSIFVVITAQNVLTWRFFTSLVFAYAWISANILVKDFRGRFSSIYLRFFIRSHNSQQLNNMEALKGFLLLCYSRNVRTIWK